MYSMNVLFRLFTLFFVLSLVGCQSSATIVLLHPEDKIASVEILEICSGKENSLKFLDEESIADIIDDLKSMNCYMYFNDPCQTIEGMVIKIVYSNGDYDLVTSSSHAFYSNEQISFRREYFDKDTFDILIDKYLAIIDMSHTKFNQNYKCIEF